MKKVLFIISCLLFIGSFVCAQETVKLKTADVSAPDTVSKKEIPVTKTTNPVITEEQEVQEDEEIAPPEERIVKVKKPKKIFPVVRPTMLFTTPTARVISSLAIQTAGGGTISTEYEEQKRKFFQGVIGVGLGGISELQINTLGVFDNLTHGSTNVPGTSFKIRIFQETKRFVETSIMLRTSPGWVSTSSTLDNGSTYFNFMSKSATFYVLASKKIGDVSIHFGGEASDYRLKREGAKESQNTFYGGMIGFEKSVNPNTILLGELRRVPELLYSTNDECTLNNIILGVFGVRFFFLKIFSLDAGITYASDCKGIADAILHTNVTGAFSLEELNATLFQK